MEALLNSPPFPVKPSTVPVELGKRIGPLGLIVLMHVGFFYALQSGLARQPVQTPRAPKEVFATLIKPQPTPAPKAEPVKAPEAPPKTVPVKKKHHRPAPKPVVKKHLAPAPVVEDKPSPVAAVPPVAAPPATPPAPAPVSVPAAVSAPSTPPAPPQPARPKTISGVEYLRPPSPEYPAMSRRMREEGTATLRVLINERGHAERIELQKSSGSSRLDAAARKAVSQAAFKPYVEDGKALAVYVIIPIKFQLD